MKQKETILTIAQVLEVGAYYAALIRVQDWDIEYEIVSPAKIDDMDGRCFRWPMSRTALIQLIDPAERTGKRNVYDMEQTVVHELLHVSHSDAVDAKEYAGKGNAQENGIERHIDSLAWALVMLRRDGAYQFSWETRHEDLCSPPPAMDAIGVRRAAGSSETWDVGVSPMIEPFHMGEPSGVQSWMRPILNRESHMPDLPFIDTKTRLEPVIRESVGSEEARDRMRLDLRIASIEDPTSFSRLYLEMTDHRTPEMLKDMTAEQVTRIREEFVEIGRASKEETHRVIHELSGLIPGNPPNISASLVAKNSNILGISRGFTPNQIRTIIDARHNVGEGLGTA